MTTATKPKNSVKQGKIKVEDLKIDKRYQRLIDGRRVRKMARTFDPRLLGTLEVSMRKNGRAIVFDGMHRLQAARAAGIESLPCNVHEGLSPESEAELFVSLQKERKNVTPLERFKARVFAKDKLALEVDRITKKCGTRIHDDSEESMCIRAAVSVESIYKKKGGDHLALVLSTITNTWPRERRSLSRLFIVAVSELFDTYGDKVDDVAIARMAENTPMWYLRRADTEGLGIHAHRGTSRVAEELRKAAGLRRSSRA